MRFPVPVRPNWHVPTRSVSVDRRQVYFIYASGFAHGGTVVLGICSSQQFPCPGSNRTE